MDQSNDKIHFPGSGITLVRDKDDPTKWHPFKDGKEFSFTEKLKEDFSSIHPSSKGRT